MSLKAKIENQIKELNLDIARREEEIKAVEATRLRLVAVLTAHETTRNFLVQTLDSEKEQDVGAEKNKFAGRTLKDAVELVLVAAKGPVFLSGLVDLLIEGGYETAMSRESLKASVSTVISNNSNLFKQVKRGLYKLAK